MSEIDYLIEEMFIAIDAGDDLLVEHIVKAINDMVAQDEQS